MSGSRRQHIQSVLRVFRRRGAGHNVIRGWLEKLFGPGGTHTPTEIPCRHGRGKKHDARTHGLRPCKTTGVRDGSKAPKLVISDLRERARRYCRDRGLKLLPWDRRADLPRADWTDAGEEDEENARDLAAEAEEEAAMLRAMTEHGAELDSDPVRPSSGVVRRNRTSTGVRAYVFTYLWHHSADASRFMEAVNALSLDQNVMHLCGCGMQEFGGCTEPTHLRLGTKQENAAHTSFHLVLRNANAARYPVVKASINEDNLPYGRGIL